MQDQFILEGKKEHGSMVRFLPSCMAQAGAALFPVSTSEEMARMEPRPFLSSDTSAKSAIF
jgi:hypothetical protein